MEMKKGYDVPDWFTCKPIGDIASRLYDYERFSLALG